MVAQANSGGMLSKVYLGTTAANEDSSTTNASMCNDHVLLLNGACAALGAFPKPLRYEAETPEVAAGATNALGRQIQPLGALLWVVLL